MTLPLQEESISTTDTIDLAVREVRPVAEDCIVMVLETADGAELPEWSPGAHIDLILGDDLVRQYSLCGDPADRSRWRIGILREPESRGGSEFLHDSVRAGATLTARGPRNHFPLQPSDHYLFVAGGIGITPILTMIHAAERQGASWRLLYGGRRRASMAFLDELDGFGDKIQVCPQDECGLLDLTSYLSTAPAGTAVYCCGPEPLIAATEEICATKALPLHVERFAPKQDADVGANEEFEVVCAESDITVTVPADSTILAEVRKVGIEVLSSCSEGTCGTCEADVLEGEPDHRDSVLTPQERASNESMMICVSRCVGKRLVLDL
ncbi:PDR/VanB family oxidoreductase [Mycolicibacterium chitae]|nr:PDR/VanB family oxidoreductase [Mycolicibacterium chitae]